MKIKAIINEFKSLDIAGKARVIFNILGSCISLLFIIFLIVSFIKSSISNKLFIPNNESGYTGTSGFNYMPTKYYSFGLDDKGNIVFSPIAEGEVNMSDEN